MKRFAAWACMLAGTVTVDAANDDFWTEVVAGLLFFPAAYMLMTPKEIS